MSDDNVLHGSRPRSCDLTIPELVELLQAKTRDKADKDRESEDSSDHDQEHTKRQSKKARHARLRKRQQAEQEQQEEEEEAAEMQNRLFQLDLQQQRLLRQQAQLQQQQALQQAQIQGGLQGGQPALFLGKGKGFGVPFQPTNYRFRPRGRYASAPSSPTRSATIPTAQSWDQMPARTSDSEFGQVPVGTHTSITSPPSPPSHHPDITSEHLAPKLALAAQNLLSTPSASPSVDQMLMGGSPSCLGTSASRSGTSLDLGVGTAIGPCAVDSAVGYDHPLGSPRLLRPLTGLEELVLLGRKPSLELAVLPILNEKGAFVSLRRSQRGALLYVKCGRLTAADIALSVLHPGGIPLHLDFTPTTLSWALAWHSAAHVAENPTSPGPPPAPADAHPLHPDPCSTSGTLPPTLQVFLDPLGTRLITAKKLDLAALSGALLPLDKSLSSLGVPGLTPPPLTPTPTTNSAQQSPEPCFADGVSNGSDHPQPCRDLHDRRHGCSHGLPPPCGRTHVDCHGRSHGPQRPGHHGDGTPVSTSPTAVSTPPTPWLHCLFSAMAGWVPHHSPHPSGFSWADGAPKFCLPRDL